MDFKTLWTYLAPRSKQTDSMTNCTNGGGFWNTFSSFMSVLLRDSKAFTAASMAGIAVSKSL